MLINCKKSLRKLYSSIRNGIDKKSKSEFDRKIATAIINSVEFGSCDNILIYVSFGSEINTDLLIDYSINIGKSVFVPVWSNNEMDFYKINSRDELTNDINGIKVPDICNRQKYFFCERTLCLVPGLAFDIYGNRLGYGGGYYDRFLSDNPNISTFALCYERCLSLSILPNEKHDISIKKIITENYVMRSENINGK